MNSFDVFDTLLARRYINSDPVWQHLEVEFSLPGFMNKRKAADTGGRSLYEIYDALVTQGDIPVEQRNRLIQREIELEISISIPIQKNLNKVQHGDILISDMYLPASAIMQLVRSVGLDKQVTLYQSNGDKSNGSVWPKFKDVKPGYHLGDNRRSDYDSPVQSGINGVWFHPATEFNAIEQEFVNAGLCSIGLLCREIRLATDTDSEYFHMANNLNLPMLFVIAELLQRQTNKNIVFLGRDCQQLYRLYNAYFGLSYYLPFSRMVAYNQPDVAKHYLAVHSPDNPLYFDMSSTGGTWEKLQGDINVTVAVYSDQAFYTLERPVTPAGFNWLTTNSEIGQTNIMLEVLNCADHGHLNRIEVYQDKLMQAHFGEPELPASIINDVHSPVLQAIKLVEHYRKVIRKELADTPTEKLITHFSAMAMEICKQENMLNGIQGFLNKEDTYLNQFTQ